MIHSFPLFYRMQNQLPIFSLFTYSGDAVNIISKLKNGENAELNRLLSEILIQKIPADVFAGAHVVVPVPGKIKPLKDHAELMAESISKRLNITMVSDLVGRSSLLSQKSMKLRERTDVKFMLLRDSDASAEGVWILVDDVITTGMTLLELHKTLGQPKALCLTLATRQYYD